MATPFQDGNSKMAAPKWQLHLKMSTLHPGIASKFLAEMRKKKHERENNTYFIKRKRVKFLKSTLGTSIPDILPELPEMSKSGASKFWG